MLSNCLTCEGREEIPVTIKGKIVYVDCPECNSPKTQKIFEYYLDSVNLKPMTAKGIARQFFYLGYNAHQNIHAAQLKILSKQFVQGKYK